MGRSKKILDRISDTLGLYEEDYDTEDEQVQEEAESPKKKRSLTRPAASSHSQAAPAPITSHNPASSSDTEIRSRREARAAEKKRSKGSLFGHKKSEQGRNKTIDMPLSKKQIKVVVIEPADFNDSQKVADFLRNNQPVVVNFETTDGATKKRMTDFIYGTIYALGGSIKQIGNNILVCAPKNVDIDADTSIYSSDKGGSKWMTK